jgi:hypothetical protein
MARFSDRWYARRPYQKLGESLIDFFNSPVRFLKESNTIESQFEKPYLTGNYQDMQFKIPDPDWPTWKFGQSARRKAPVTPFPYDVNTLPYRRFHGECPCCFFVWWGDCDDNGLNGGQFMTVFSDYPWNSFTHGWHIFGNYKDFRTYPPYFSGDPRYTANSTAAFADAAYFDYDETALTGDGFAFVTLCYEIAGVCIHCVDYWAPCVAVDCPPAVPFTFDDASTPDTIAVNTSISIYVAGGSPTYSWSVTGNGYTVGAPTTSGVVNTLISGAAPCNCTTLDSFAEVTVTDGCGGSVSFSIRNTSGQWKTVGGEGSSSVCGITISGYCNVPGFGPSVFTYQEASNGYPNRWLTQISQPCQGSYNPIHSLDPDGNGLQGSGGAFGGTDTLSRGTIGCPYGSCCISTGNMDYWVCTAFSSC